ncbi:MAG: phage GP46 family protein [Nitrosomonadaceae bacterium]
MTVNLTTDAVLGSRSIVPVDDVIVDLPLMSSLRGTVDGDPTFNRATIATVIDFEGLVKTVEIGESRFQGARRVANLIDTSSVTLAVSSANTMTLGAGDYIFSMGAGGGTATFSGTGGATGTLVADAFNRTAVDKTITAGTLIVTASVEALVDLQVELVTGQSIQRPSEPVSVGVESPPFHGAAVDGVRYLETLNGNTVANNIVTQATGITISAGGKFAVLPGAVGDFFYTPDSVALSIEGNIDIRADVMLFDWTPAVGTKIVAKGSASGQYSYWLEGRFTGGVRLVTTANGVTELVAQSADLGFVDGSRHLIRADLLVNDGAGNRITTFYTSDDNGITWDIVGSPVVQAGATTIFNSTSPVQIGAFHFPTSIHNMDGTVYKAQILDGIDGTVVMDFNPNDSVDGGNWVGVDTGEDWMINSNASVFIGQWDDSGPFGYLGEAVRTNLILNSASMSTQAITTTAAQRALSFTGTGTLTLTGTSTAGPLVGTGITDRVSLIYTPTAGALTLTVSGTVEMAQDELGSFASSWIPTEGSTVTRNADQLFYPSLNNISDTEGTALATVEATDWANAAGNILGQQVGDLPGVVGDYFSTPDSVANSITGGISLRQVTTLANWATGNFPIFICKFGASGFRSYCLGMNNTGFLSFIISATGTGFTNVFSTKVVPFSANQLGGVRGDWDPADNFVTFYTSVDLGRTWQQLGDTVPLVLSGIFDSSEEVIIGHDGNQVVAANVYSSQILNGIDGPVVVDFNPNDSDGSSPFTSLTTGEAWTFVGNASIVASEAPLLADTSNSGIQSFDGTNTASGPAGTPSGLVDVSVSWVLASMQAFAGGIGGVVSSYDGAFSLTQLNVGQSGWFGTIRDLKILGSESAIKSQVVKWDISIDETGDILTADFFDTSLLVSIFAEKRASESEVPDSRLRRGWIGNESFTDGFEIGSKIWLFEQARLNRDTFNGITSAAIDSLQWLLDDGFVLNLAVDTVLINGEVALQIDIFRPNSKVDRRFFSLWDASGVTSVEG